MQTIIINDVEYSLTPVPPKPVFKLYDIVRYIGDDDNKVITSITDDRYYFDNNLSYLQFSGQHKYQLVGFVEQRQVILQKFRKDT